MIYLDPQTAEEYVRSQKLRGDVGQKELTCHEEEVLRLFAQGHSNEKIATRLNIDIKTVESHQTNAMEKLGLRS